MKKDDIKKYLSGFNNVMDIVQEANKLKAAGENEIMVNRCVAELRKERLNASATVNPLERIAVANTFMEPVSFIPVQVSNLSSPILVFDGENILM